MEPGTVANIGMGSTIGGGLLKAFGGIQSGMSQSQMYDYQAQVARINAGIALQNRDYALNKGSVEAQGYGLKARQISGQIRAAQGASGLDVNSGSAKRVQESQDMIAHMDLDQIRSNAAKTAYDFTIQAANFENQATAYDAASSNSMMAGWINGLGSIIGTAGSVADRWLQGSQVGLYGGGSNNSSSGFLSHEASHGWGS